jgi:hypothetical protein
MVFTVESTASSYDIPCVKNVHIGYMVSHQLSQNVHFSTQNVI